MKKQVKLRMYGLSPQKNKTLLNEQYNSMFKVRILSKDKKGEYIHETSK